MLSPLLLLVSFLFPVHAVFRKCCPQKFSLHLLDNGTLSCLPSSHNWLYANFTTGLPDCQIRLQQPILGSESYCIDNKNNTENLLSLECDAESDVVTFSIPNINYVRKCCPIERKYDSRLQSCWGEEEVSWPTSFLNVLLHGTRGVVDLQEGAPKCPPSQVLVDHLVPSHVLRREPSGAIFFSQDGRQLLVNPDESCVDRTELQEVLVVRVCQDARLACQHYTCITKCCPDGKSFLEPREGCVPTNKSVRPLRLFDGDKPIVGRTPAYRFYEIQCSAGKYAEDLGQTYRLFQNGVLYNPSYDTQYHPGSYCLENVESQQYSLVGDYVYLCFPEEPQDGYSLEEDMIFDTFGMIVSCVFLFLTFIVYSLLPFLRNLHGKTLMCHVFCLLVAYSCLVTIQFITDRIIQHVCVILGYMVQFTFLAAFAWLNVISFDIWLTFGSMRPAAGRPGRDRKRFILYSLYAWSFPTLLTGSTIAADNTDILPDYLKPGVGREACWFSSQRHGILLFFIGPESCLFISNAIFFYLTARHCSKVKSELNKVGHTPIAEKRFEADKRKLVTNMKLFVVMGVSWLLEVVSWFVIRPHQVWYLSDMANSLQGLLIFCIFILKRRVLLGLRRRLAELCCCSPQVLGPTRPPSVSTITVSSESHLKKAASEGRLSPLPSPRPHPNPRSLSANRLTVW